MNDQALTKRRMNRCALVAAIAVLLVPAAASAKTGEVTRSGSTYTGKVDGTTYYSGPDYIAAIQASVNNLTSGRTSKETVNIRNSGDSGQAGGSVKAVNIASYTILNFNSTTFNVNDTTLLVVPVQGEKKSNIEVRNLRVTGKPRYGIWLKTCSNITLNNITMNLSNAGLGTRVDDSKGGWSFNLTMNGTQTYTGCGDHAVETYGVDGFNIGNVSATDCGGCGVLLNKTKNGTVGTVTGIRCNPGGGYAAFRIANSAGPNITCTKVYARGCGRGFFSVTGSNGCTINTVDIADSTSHGMLLENASNVRVLGGTIANCGSDGVRFAQNSHHNTVQGIRVGPGNARGVIETSPGNYNQIHNCNCTGNDSTNLSKSGANTTTNGSTW